MPSAIKPRPLAAALALALLPGSPGALAESADRSSPAISQPKLAGARYGQALGASMVCPFIAMQPAAESLLRRFDGADLEAFKTEAQRVALVWKKTLGCDPRADINRCRVLSEKSCSEALKEIGPDGTAEPGLIVFRKVD
jgi:hypothetical protein